MSITYMKVKNVAHFKAFVVWSNCQIYDDYISHNIMKNIVYSMKKPGPFNTLVS